MQGSGKLIAAAAAALGLFALDAQATGETPVMTGDLKVFKTVDGALMQWTGLTFDFEVRQGASATSAGTLVAGGLQATDANNGFVLVPALPFGTYQVCEVNIPAGWRSSLADGGFVPNSVGNAFAVTTTVCKDVVVQYPWVHMVEVNNTRFTEPPPPPPPASAPTHTIGYWKNWSSCSGGKQDALLDQALAAAGGIRIGDLVVDTCAEAVALLNKSDLGGMKRATDAAYRLAAQLLGARLNFQAGAVRCDAAVASADSAQALLDGIGFTGTGAYKAVVSADAADMLAEHLDEYNNGNLCE